MKKKLKIYYDGGESFEVRNLMSYRIDGKNITYSSRERLNKHHTVIHNHLIESGDVAGVRLSYVVDGVRCYHFEVVNKDFSIVDGELMAVV